MEQMGVDEVTFGILTDGMQLQNVEILDFKKFIRPWAELEISY